MIEDLNNEKRASTPTQSNEHEGLRPIYLLVVFWGETHRNYFAKFLLPSLLAPGNIPAISSVQGSKLVICTTKMDWEALQPLPLFKEVQKYVELLLIEIDLPTPGVNKYLHVSAGFKLAFQKCWKDGAYGTLLVPDLILSNGTLKHFRELAAAGIKAALVPSLRYDLDGSLAKLRAKGLYDEDRALVASGRELAGIGLANFHSQTKRYEWNSPYFCRQPFTVWWRNPSSGNTIVHTTGWQMGLVNFHALSAIDDSSLDYTTPDDVFINQNFYRFRDEGSLHLIADSDDAFYLCVESEADLTFYPLKALLLNRVPIVGSLIKRYALQLFINSRMFDPFRRWAMTFPVYIHEQPLEETNMADAAMTVQIMLRAVQPPGRLLRFYGKMPARAVVLSIVDLGLKNPRLFVSKLWGRLFGRRRASASP